jgi:replicative DNA helicase
MSGEKELLDRLPPQNQEAERAVLGSMLKNNKIIPDIVQILAAEDFYADAHQKIYQTIVQLNDQGGKAVDLVILAEALLQRGYLADMGDYGYLAQVYDAAPSSANAEHYAQIVRDKAKVRNLILAGNEILSSAYSQSMPADQLVESAERLILDVAEKGITTHLCTLGEAIAETYDRIDKRTTDTQMSFSGLSTGFADLNELTAGLQKSELIIIAARPSIGKTAFSLALTRNVVLGEREPVFFVSLEQSRVEIAERLMCTQARVDSHRLRKGTLTSDDMEKLVEAGTVLSQAKLFIDDTPGQTMLRIAANARRLHTRQHIKLVVIDYLQLIEPENRRDPRQEQVAQISRRLKFLARELQIPVVALAQVNRSSEDRQDHRPRLSDLRESGCLSGDARVVLAENGEQVPIRELVGKCGFLVWALDETTMSLRAAEVSKVFTTGRKAVFHLRTRLGRSIRATANHRFRTFNGWRRLDELKAGDRLALPRRVPAGCVATLQPAQLALLGHMLGDGCALERHSLQYTTREEELGLMVVGLAREVFGDRLRPRLCKEVDWYQVYLPSSARLTHGRRNPLAAWLDTLGVFGKRAWDKRVPALVFAQPADQIATFLRHLWSTDGCVKAPSGKTRHPAIYYASSSEGLARDVQALLLRLGINSVLCQRDQGHKGRPQHHVLIMGREDVLAFADRIGVAGKRRTDELSRSRAWVASRRANTNRDVIPRDVWRQHVLPVMQRKNITVRALQEGMGMACCGTTLYKQNVSRARLTRVIQAVGGDRFLEALAHSDVYWDEIIQIQPDGEEEVYDLTVPGLHNFVANDIIVHNSIEQDADTVLMLHRPDRYEPGQQEGVIEVIVAKNRNGPVGEITLAYLKQYLRFEDFKIGTPFDA